MYVGYVGLRSIFAFFDVFTKTKYILYHILYVGLFSLFIYLCRVRGILSKVYIEKKIATLGKKPYNPTQPYINHFLKVIYCI